MLDLDGDGKADTIFTDGTTGFGIKTATGAIITANPLLGGGGDHHAWAMTMDSEPPVAVVDDGHTASVFALVNCKLVTPKNPQGKRYTFTLEGFGPYGTGVTCAGSQRGGYTLRGVNAVKSAVQGRCRAVVGVKVVHGRLLSARGVGVDADGVGRGSDRLSLVPFELVSQRDPEGRHGNRGLLLRARASDS